MLTLDGSHGEGGGQILRTSLALAAITGTPVTITNVRAGRDRPGLQRQHLVAVRAAARICNGELHGDEISSREIRLIPQAVVAGEYHFDIGSAGSTSLVLQTVLPPLLIADAPSRVVISGGTHNPLAPSFEFLRDAFLPCLAAIGAQIELRLDRHGFHPAGGGRLTCDIQPLAAPRPLHLIERGRPVSRQIRAGVANLPLHIAEREIDTARRRLQWSPRETAIDVIDGSDGPGNVLTVTLIYANVTEVVISTGALRVPAEQVATRAVRDVKRYLAATSPVGEHLADQLLLPLAVTAGGCFRAIGASLHASTNAWAIERFLGPRVTIRPLIDDEVEIDVRAYARPSA